MKVFLYIRVACADQLAAADQREELERYAKDKGYEVAAAVAADGISGVHTEGIMNFLLNEAKRQDIGTILTRDTSRISRDTSSFMRFERKFRENGIRFEYLSKPDNELPVTPMMEAFAAAYKKRRTKNGWLSTYERLVNSQNFFSPYLTQEDMSRFGRNYLQVGMYTEMLFPEYGVHFIAVNDGVDSVRGDSEFTAIRNVFNEMYAKDTSKKIRATWQSKGRSGEHLTTIPPYGYKKDPENKKRWIVDEEAAAVVQKIFALCMDGMGPTQIAKWLQENKVLSPVAYCYENDLPTTSKRPTDPYKWATKTVVHILERLDYLGHTVNFKTSKQSFKSKKVLWNDPADWVIFENTQEPIIEESVFLIVQKIRQDGRHGYVLRPAVLCGLRRKDVLVQSQSLQT